MNSCVLMAEIVQEPQLRYTADNLAVTEMLVQFPNSQKAEDAPATLKVVGWGNLATDIQGRRCTSYLESRRLGEFSHRHTAKLSSRRSRRFGRKIRDEYH